ncbi:heavy-metal-associated domain-containing protein [Arthrobacter rhombi]|uniref:heavy-metal-associated domain-containing protein n=1 Tax=Arthrobacter rhombi TaxID=71253 RepID=UPI003FD576CB
MKAPVRLGLYGLVLVVVFVVAFATAGAAVPEQTVQSWAGETKQADHDAGGDQMDMTEHDGDASSMGLAVAEGGYQLTALAAPAETNKDGRLSLSITGPNGKPVTDFDLEHDKELHLITVRSDGQHFRHVHPEMDAEGTWSIPWQWDAPGSYRMFADFVPTETGDNITLSSSAQVAGDYDPVPTEPVATAATDGYEVNVEGDLVAGEPTDLRVSVSQDGVPVTNLEPYLGAFGHMVALREGDLAYLHVHPHGDEPRAGETSGPEIVFGATAPTPGRYLLYVDFQVDGQVHTAPLVMDTRDEAGAKSGQQR